MSKCFITKLPSSVDNDNLPVLGQLRIKWLKQDSLTNSDARTISLRANNNITVKVYGAHFTDNTLASNFGDTKTISVDDGEVLIHVSNDADAILTIDNKYALTILNCSRAPSVYFDIDDIKYCTNLTYLELSKTQVNGDISALSKLTNIDYLNLSKTQVNGDISTLSKLSLKNALVLAGTQVSGDISALNKFTNSATIDVCNTRMSGNAESLNNLANLKHMSLQGTNINGFTTEVINRLTKLTDCTINDISGDISQIRDGIDYLEIAGGVACPVSWTANSRQNKKLLCLPSWQSGCLQFGTDLDNMLIDQATCNYTNVGSKGNIRVKGTRTSASDAALTNIQNKGVTVTILS